MSGSLGKYFIVYATIIYITLVAGSQDSRPSTKEANGHMLPFGEHRPPEGPIAEEADFVDPETFFNKYTHPGVPVLFKGAAKHMPAFNLWNDKYLQDKYGKMKVVTEEAKKENRTKGMRSMRMSSFLNIYKDSDIYMVQDAVDPLRKDLTLPKPLVCGGFQKQLSASILWFSSGGTKSVLHNDDTENVNCLFDGSKRFYMIDKKFRDRIEGQHYVYRRGYSKVDVDKVDMHKFPGLQDLEWWDVRMDKGDCLYIPSRWYHIVDSAGPRNLAVNTWFRPMETFNISDCELYAGKIPDHPALSEFELEGMENHDTPKEKNNEEESSEMKKNVDGVFWEFQGETQITRDDFKAVYMQDAMDWEIDVVFLILDVDKDDTITWPELELAEVDALLTIFPFLEPIKYDVKTLEEVPTISKGSADDQPFGKDEL